VFVCGVVCTWDQLCAVGRPGCLVLQSFGQNTLWHHYLHICMVLASSKDSTLVMARSMVHLPA